eukprot:GFYU01000453.1.p1 GENE.GFYU01000453.1~~GFYU01000453.1.p1  ORF type:complete len:207 (-),score=82.25 GFYU01000453.1:90-710(-)
MPKHNNIIPNAHFKKDWQNRVKTWLDQPGRKKSRRDARKAKAAAIAPRPVAGLLRPIVRGQTNKYNLKVKAGRGFTLEELKEAGVSQNVARSIGIAVDHRRKNKSLDAFRTNVQRLSLYKSKLVVFPKKANKPKSGDSTAAETATATQLVGDIIPVRPRTVREKARKITADEKKQSVFYNLRTARANARLAGIRKKRADEEAAANA